MSLGLRENNYDVILLNDDYETDGGTLEQTQLELLREFLQQHVPSPSYFVLREGDERDGDIIMSMRKKHARLLLNEKDGEHAGRLPWATNYKAWQN